MKLRVRRAAAIHRTFFVTFPMFALMVKSASTTSDRDHHICEPRLVGLTRQRRTALNHVIADPERNSANFYPDPVNDEITTLEITLDRGMLDSLSEDDESWTEPDATDRTLTPLEARFSQNSSSDDSSYNNDGNDGNDVPTFFMSDFGTLHDPLTALIDLCDAFDRLNQFCQLFGVPYQQTYDIMSKCITHLDTCTTPILRRFIVRIPYELPCCRKLLFLLLQGALDTMDGIQRHYEGRRRHRKELVQTLLNLLLTQMAEIRGAAEVCIDSNCTL